MFYSFIQLCRAWGEGAHRAWETWAGAAGIPGACQEAGRTREEETSKRNGDRRKGASQRRGAERFGWSIFKKGR